MKDEDRLLVPAGLIDQGSNGFRSTRPLHLAEPIPERVDLRGIHGANADLQHSTIVALPRRTGQGVARQDRSTGSAGAPPEATARMSPMERLHLACRITAVAQLAGSFVLQGGAQNRAAVGVELRPRFTRVEIEDA
jgi:hypothetical protein